MARPRSSARRRTVVNGTNKKPKPIVIDLDQINLEPITRTGYSRLLKEIEDYKTERSIEISLLTDLKQGGSDEDATDDVKETNFRIGIINGNIDKLNAFRACVIFIDDLGITDDGFVGIGRIVTLSSHGIEYELAILGVYESNAESVMSYQAPLAEMLKGHKIGETIVYDGTEIEIKGIRLYKEGEEI